MDKKKYLIAVYIIVTLIGIIFLITAYYSKSDYWVSVFQNFSTELLGVVFIFFLINYFLINDEWELTAQVKKLIEQNTKNKFSTPSEIFDLSNLPHNVEDSLFENAKNIFISGYSLSRITRQKTNLFSKLLEQGVNIHFIMLDYKDKEVLNQISLRTTDNFTKNFWKTRLIEGHSIINAINHNAQTSGVLKLRFIPYIPGFGLMLIERNNGNNDCYTIIYPHKTGHQEPAFKVNNSTDDYWYTFFKQQFDILWESSREE